MNLIGKHKAEQDEEIYRIKVILSDWHGRIRGRPHRVIAVPEELTLYSLAEEIVAAFDFYFDHCFGFYDNIKRWTESNECYELFKDIEKEEMLEPSRCKSVKRTKINRVFNKVGKRMLFLFDYGDQWHFIVELKRIESQEKDKDYPLIVESVGKAPPQYGEIDE